MEEKKDKHAGGRPSDYEPRFVQIAYDLMAEGAAIEELCWHMRRHKQTIYEWMEKFPEFGDAIRSGQQFAKGWWYMKGRTNIDNKEFNSTLWYMNMKNRYGWRDKIETDNNTNMTVSAEISEAKDFIESRKKDI